MSHPHYRHDIENCIAALKAEDFAGLPGLAASTVKNFKDNEKVLPLLKIAGREDDLDSINKKALEIRNNFKNIIVLGTGGSSLGGQALSALKRNNVNIRFADNIDPSSFSALLSSIEIKETFFLAISKSGETLETIAQFLICFGLAAKALGGDATKHFLIITMEQDSNLSRLARRHGIETLAHAADIGGRFSTLTNVGLLPAAIMGLDITGLRKGAATVIAAIDKNPLESEVAKGIAVNLAMLRRGFSNFVYMHYLDALSGFVTWHRQIWAESLGKNGHGATPIRASGTLDQHSQLQLYLEGPQDKFFTMFFLENSSGGPAINPELADTPELEYLKGKNPGGNNGCRAAGDDADANRPWPAAPGIRSQ